MTLAAGARSERAGRIKCYNLVTWHWICKELWEICEGACLRKLHGWWRRKRNLFSKLWIYQTNQVLWFRILSEWNGEWIKMIKEVWVELALLFPFIAHYRRFRHFPSRAFEPKWNEKKRNGIKTHFHREDKNDSRLRSQKWVSGWRVEGGMVISADGGKICVILSCTSLSYWLL